MNTDRFPVALTDPRGWAAWKVWGLAQGLARLAHRMEAAVPDPDSAEPSFETIGLMSRRLGVSFAALASKMVTE